tara:strand:+ start:280 stop:678 length:399 start_codon:yes stop_codon:yes gene_type:complete
MVPIFVLLAMTDTNLVVHHVKRMQVTVRMVFWKHKVQERKIIIVGRAIPDFILRKTFLVFQHVHPMFVNVLTVLKQLVHHVRRAPIFLMPIFVLLAMPDMKKKIISNPHLAAYNPALGIRVYSGKVTVRMVN